MVEINTIKKFTQEEIFQIARLHSRNIKSGFLSSLGENFLTIMYESIQTKGILIGVKRNNEIIGFVSGVTDLNSVYIEFVRKKILKIIIILFPKIFSILVFKNLIELALYPFRKGSKKVSLPQAELLSIVVHENHRGTGIADALYQKLIEEFKVNKIKAFKIIVGGALIPAQKFYEKKGASKSESINIHKGDNSWVYIHQIL